MCIDQLGSFIPISNLHIHLLLLQYFVQTFIKWNSGKIRCFDFFKQKVFEIREKSKIHNVTIFSPAHLERLDISLSINMLQKSLFNPRHDLREKWLELIHQKYNNLVKLFQLSKSITIQQRLIFENLLMVKKSSRTFP